MPYLEQLPRAPSHHHAAGDPAAVAQQADRRKPIEVLIRAGILTKVGAKKRDRLYRYDRYLRLLD